VKAGPDILRQVATLHAAAIDRGFLSSLGTRFLVELYRAIDAAPGAFLLVEERDGRVAGFIAGASDPGTVRRCLLRRPLALFASLAPVLVQPRKLAGVLEALRADAAPGGLPKPELLSLAVDRGYRGQGVADALYARLVQAFSGLGVKSFRIVVGSGLGPAHRFYRRMGAVPRGTTEVHRGQGSIVYVHDTGENTA
jgi:GNAT superfamily N-acetyltransferase